MSNPAVSVIIPAYNAQDYIQKCLDSILAQTFKDIEIIVVNDGSKDNTEAVVQEVAKTDERIVLINQENKKIGGARNTALKVAKGDFILYVDSDDSIDTNFVETLHNAITKYNADIAVSQFRFNKGNKKWYGIKYNKTKLYTDKEVILKKMQIPPYWNCLGKLYRKTALDGIYFEENVFFEDIRYALRIFSKDVSVVTCSGTNYNYLVNDYSVTGTATSSPEKSLERLKVTLRDVLEIQKNNIPIKNFYIYKEKKSIFRIRHYNDRIKWYLLGVPFYVKHQTFDVEGYLKANNLEL